MAYLAYKAATVDAGDWENHVPSWEYAGISPRCVRPLSPYTHDCLFLEFCKARDREVESQARASSSANHPLRGKGPGSREEGSIGYTLGTELGFAIQNSCTKLGLEKQNWVPKARHLHGVVDVPGPASAPAAASPSAIGKVSGEEENGAGIWRWATAVVHNAGDNLSPYCARLQPEKQQNRHPVSREQKQTRTTEI